MLADEKPSIVSIGLSIDLPILLQIRPYFSYLLIPHIWNYILHLFSEKN